MKNVQHNLPNAKGQPKRGNIEVMLMAMILKTFEWIFGDYSNFMVYLIELCIEGI